MANTFDDDDFTQMSTFNLLASSTAGLSISPESSPAVEVNPGGQEVLELEPSVERDASFSNCLPTEVIDSEGQERAGINHGHFHSHLACSTRTATSFFTQITSDPQRIILIGSENLESVDMRDDAILTLSETTISEIAIKGYIFARVPSVTTTITPILQATGGGPSSDITSFSSKLSSTPARTQLSTVATISGSPVSIPIITSLIETSPTSTSPLKRADAALSTGAKVGIAVSVSLGAVFLLALAAAWHTFHRRRKLQKYFEKEEYAATRDGIPLGPPSSSTLGAPASPLTEERKSQPIAENPFMGEGEGENQSMKSGGTSPMLGATRLSTSGTSQLMVPSAGPSRNPSATSKFSSRSERSVRFEPPSPTTTNYRQSIYLKPPSLTTTDHPQSRPISTISDSPIEKEVFIPTDHLATPTTDERPTSMAGLQEALPPPEPARPGSMAGYQNAVPLLFSNGFTQIGSPQEERILEEWFGRDGLAFGVHEMDGEGKKAELG